MHYTIIQPIQSSPRAAFDFFTSPADLSTWLNEIPTDDYLAIDFETSGLRVFEDEFFAVGLGFSCSIGNAYISLRDMSPADIQILLLALNKFKLVAHNAYYDGQVFYKYTGVHANWESCSYGYARQLATEGEEGQRWGLSPLLHVS